MPYLVSYIIGEPVQSFIEPFPRGGTCALNIPVMNKKKKHPTPKSNYHQYSIKMAAGDRHNRNAFEYQWR